MRVNIIKDQVVMYQPLYKDVVSMAIIGYERNGGGIIRRWNT